MKVLVWLFLTCGAVFVSADYFIEFDWSNVRPGRELFLERRKSPIQLQSAPLNVQRTRRIVNGEIATPHQFPYQAALLFTFPQGTSLCGGALISSRTILTAAHCVDVSSGGTVILGAHFINTIEPSQQRIPVTRDGIVVHPQWDPNLIRNDVATLHLSSAANLVPNVVSLIDLPPPESVTNFENFPATVSGWGRFDDNLPQASDVLRFYRGTILPQSNCALRFPGVVQPSNICLSGQNNGGACQGDSGGPLTTTYNGRHTHIGIVSFGLALGCELTWPSVFARTSFYSDWINLNTI